MSVRSRATAGGEGKGPSAAGGAAGDHVEDPGDDRAGGRADDQAGVRADDQSGARAGDGTGAGAADKTGAGAADETVTARRIEVRGVVQGVGFRPFVYRLATRHAIAGWVLNAGEGVSIHAEGAPAALAAFAAGLAAVPPPAAVITTLNERTVAPEHHAGFTIRTSAATTPPTVRISPDLTVCDACLADLADPADRRYGYPYVNCTDCGPRYTIVRGLPYDRAATTMAGWPMCADCAREYEDPGDRRFHAQPVACPVCGPAYRLEPAAPAATATPDGSVKAIPVETRPPVATERPATARVPPGPSARPAAIAEAARLLATGRILAIKGLGGYHLACDATDAVAVASLRQRKFRKEKPFALMARDLETARATVELDGGAEALLVSIARPVVVVPARRELPGVAPGNPDLGVMLPSTPLHHLLFAAGAPPLLVMTSANRSSEPIAYQDDDARARLAGLADAWLIGERPIARRVDDSVVRPGPQGPTVLRRARGYAPGAVARLPGETPILALGADLKNTITLVVDGEAFVSQHVGDLSHYAALEAFRETVADLLAMYRVDPGALCLVHDLHPQYASTAFAQQLPAARRLAVQHHRAHLASVLAERGELDRRVVGLALDGTGYGDDGTIWGGEIFVGSVAAGFERVAHLRPARLPGGDAAARFPVQAAAGFLAEVAEVAGVDFTAPPFGFPERFRAAGKLLAADLRTFSTTSTGRLFDTLAAILGFTREVSFEGQAAIWLEHLAASAPADVAPFPMPFADGVLDWRPALAVAVAERRAGRDPAAIARAFHRGLAQGLAEAAVALAAARGIATAVASGGVLQNRLLADELAAQLAARGIVLWAQRLVPPNDGGISLGQAALAAAGPRSACGAAAPSTANDTAADAADS